MKSPRVIPDPDILGGTPVSSAPGCPFASSSNIWKLAILWKSSWKTFPALAGHLRFKFSKTPRWPWCSMRILLDESVPGRFGALLIGHSAVTVQRKVAA